MSAKRKRTPWDRIVQACLKGRGVHLSAEDVRVLSSDGALVVRGEMDGECFARGHDPISCRDADCEWT